MAKLTDNQLIVLSNAAARDDGIAVIPNKMNKHDMPVRCKDEADRSISLKITRAGRDAIGLEDEVAEKSPPASKTNSRSNQSAAKERSGVGVALQEIMRRHFNIFNWLRLHKT